MNADIEEAANFKVSRMERVVVLYCKQIGIDYHMLTEEEFQWLIRIFKKI